MVPACNPGGLQVGPKAKYRAACDGRHLEGRDVGYEEELALAGAPGADE